MGKVLDLEVGMELFSQGKAYLSVCQNCKEKFYQKRGGTYAIYCSSACKQQAFRQREREKREKEVGRNAKEKA